MARPDNPKNPIDLAAIGAKLEGEGARRFWRGLDELAETEEYVDFLRHEFPYDPGQEAPGPSRREVLKLMSASAALAGLTACTKLPAEKIVPYAQEPPEEFVPGKSIYYATAMPLRGDAVGLLVESHMGRPTKVEGNPDHPSSLGATDVFAQASVLTLYDPDRSQSVIHEGRISGWSEFLTVTERLQPDLALKKGAGLRVLTGTVTSPTLADQLEALLARFPLAKWHQYEPIGRDAAREGARLAFGKYLNTVYRFDRAEVILALDSDFLCSAPGSLRYAREFAGKRLEVEGQPRMNRLYSVESAPSNTGAMADHRLPLRSSEVEAFARALADGLGVAGAASRAELSNVPSAWIPALRRDLESHRGTSVVVAGDGQPAVVHALAHAMNQELGNIGKTVILTEPVEANPVDEMQSLRELVRDMKSGRVETLVILGVNPVFTAPADLEFGKSLSNVKLRIHLGLYEDETAELCHWHIPEAHYLESWSDTRAFDGTVSIVQPLIVPLYNGKSAHEMLAVLLGQPGQVAHDIVRDYWNKQARAENFQIFWEKSLHDGLIAGTALPPVSFPAAKGAALRPSTFGRRERSAAGATKSASAAEGLEIIFRPDPTIWDGRFGNNAWLQELPKPLTKLTWDNVAALSPATARRLGVTNEDLVTLRYAGREVRAPIWIMPGHADESVTVYLGYGRLRAGRVATGVGFNAYALRTSDSPWFGAGLEIRKTGEVYSLSRTQHHHLMDNKTKEEESVHASRRDLVRIATLAEFRRDPDFARDPPEETARAPSLYPRHKYEGHAWGMVIDLNRCTGCNSCVTACRAENNVPVVGKHEVKRGREMDWIRVDTYYRGGLENPEVSNEVVLCMHCEDAPCELVCPVAATVHSPEGLNEQIYNRCVGTRYCSNNCPYKVRRFNFKLYSDWTTPSLFALRNPNVTVRSRGVMEKCTYCVQRINARKIQAEKEDRPIRDGQIVMACEQACPCRAIVFGDINDRTSRVSKLKGDSRSYGLLTELNTRPRTTYLAKLNNPNPELKE